MGWLQRDCDDDTAAETRLAECLVQETRFVDGQLYRMTGWEAQTDGVRTSFTTGYFAQYAPTVDLLEAETFAAVQAGGADLLLRDLMMPTVESVLTPDSRNCTGGTLALTAFARPAQGGRPADFALLIQERGAKVLNESRRLAVIPKCFHELTSEPTWYVSVGTSLKRGSRSSSSARQRSTRHLIPAGRSTRCTQIS